MGDNLMAPGSLGFRPDPDIDRTEIGGLLKSIF
jgi:hypothetical protein